MMTNESSSSEAPCEADTADSANKDLDGWLTDLERRTYVSFVSRARASERLATRGILWTVALSVASAATLCASIVSVANSAGPVSTSELSTTLFSLAALVLSLLVSAFNYPARSRDLFHSFREIQKISANIEILKTSADPACEIRRSAEILQADYQVALDKSENHTTFDYYKARGSRQGAEKKSDRLKRAQATVAQASLSSLPVLVSFASVAWLIVIFTNLD